MAHTVLIVDLAQARHAACQNDPLTAAMLDAVLAMRHRRIPVLLDDFVCSTTATPRGRLHATGLAPHLPFPLFGQHRASRAGS
ncbi:hypothetical protein HLH26_19460 [Gluconacetobacter sp. 1b LMG 1731]|uniref:Uncharacterized protein n=1 Tax=Gluconacetobacter dulcium TaxID=2729096 RepID=A0A7W4NWN8_9PROT|nr:hypothetical protein [Gluconacetobacter dulcium]MBB2166663.1 hypothetical protein [Gluconacetobacter dulcium]MBB2195767.1 hypothetical protein [Gluconacetobacter dulcium]